jgi:hypothetical protein
MAALWKGLALFRKRHRMLILVRSLTAKRKSRLAGLLYSSILTPHSGYRHADNIIAGRSLTGHAIAL